MHCLANGIRVSLKIKEGFNGLLYVKGYSKDERCGLVVNTPVNQESPVDFTVHFGNCGLVHVNVSINDDKCRDNYKLSYSKER